MNEIFHKDDISRFRTFVNYFIAGAVLCTVVILLETISIFVGGEITLKESLLIVFNFVFLLIILGLYFIVKKESRFLKKYIRKLNRYKSAEEIDLILEVNNKFKFIKDAEAIIRSDLEINYALVHYDLSKFTLINNSVGYKVGDEILQQIGKTLRKSLKEEIIGKAEGDNFLVLFEYDDQEDLIKRACEISEKIEKISIWNKLNIRPVVKTGICFIDKNNLDVRVAIDRAFFAKSVLKNSYKSNYAIYEEEIGNSLLEVKKLENDMHRALKLKEFKVYLQPKVNLKTGILAGAEALVRWEHPELGLLNPDRFIPLFEKNGFIVDLDRFVFEEVCSNIRRWIDLGYDVVPVSVNVSRIHFLNNNFVFDYKKVREKYGISKNLVEVEITESVVCCSGNEKEVFTVMRKFRDDGFEISMDDFGSGYSCLGLLKEMPIDTLKLDRLFLNNIEENNSQIIVSNIVNMAKNLNLNVVSEGVETNTQVDFLRNIGCDMAQGFIFAKPKPMDEYEKLINEGKINYYDIAI